MNSVIITSKNKDKRKAYIDAFCSEHKIGQFDQTVIATDEQSIGITDIRNMQKTLFLKPYNSEEKVVVMQDAEKLTTEAQNALLKVLEEPPANTYIFLSSATDAAFLPTIISRCKVVFLEEQEKEVPFADKETLENDTATIRAGSISARLLLAEKLSAQKETLPTWFERIIVFLRKKLLNDPNDITIAYVIQSLSDAYHTIQTTNVNTRLVLEHTFLQLSKYSAYQNF